MIPIVHKFLSHEGEINANGNYSGVEFSFVTTEDTQIARLLVHLKGNRGWTRYGRRALSNGFTVKIVDADGMEVQDWCDGLPIKTLADWGRYCYDVSRHWSYGQARWTFAKSGQSIDLPRGWKISIVLNDDFSSLSEHYFMLQGYVG